MVKEEVELGVGRGSASIGSYSLVIVETRG